GRDIGDCAARRSSPSPEPPPSEAGEVHTQQRALAVRPRTAVLGRTSLAPQGAESPRRDGEQSHHRKNVATRNATIIKSPNSIWSCTDLNSATFSFFGSVSRITIWS